MAITYFKSLVKNHLLTNKKKKDKTEGLTVLPQSEAKRI